MSWTIKDARTIGVRLFGSLFRRLVTLKAGSGVTITETMTGDECELEIAASGGGGVTAHTALTALAITSSGHTGTASRLWGANGAGAAAEYEIGAAGGVQAYDAGLASLTAADAAAGLPYNTGANTWASATLGDLAVSGGAWNVTQARGLRETSGPTTITMGAWADGQPLTRSGTTAVGGTIAAIYGGTGQTGYTVGDILYASTTTALSKLAAGADGYVLTSNGAGVAPSWQPALAGSSAYSVPTSDLVIDLDADVGVTISTGVSQWDCQVSASAAVQATAGKQPLVKEWGYGGHDCISFDGSDDILFIAHDAANDWTVLTVYVVFRWVPNSSNSGTFSGVVLGRLYNTTAGSPWYEWSIVVSSATQLQMRFDGTATSAITMPRPIYHGAAMSLTVGASGSSGHQDGYRTHTGAATSITYTNNAGISIGAGGYTVEQEYCKCDIARILIYDVQHTPAERHEVLMALRELYGTDPLCRAETI